MAFDFAKPIIVQRLTRAERDAARQRLAQGRAEKIIIRLALVTMIALRDGQVGSKFAFEGVFRAGLRADLCLQGWRWNAADQAAAALTAAALARIGAKRPSWNEGQPEHVIKPGLLLERTRCSGCAEPLPKGHWKFCGELCKSAHFRRIASIMKRREEDAGGAFEGV